VTGVCLHGHLENFGYFLLFYATADMRLTVISSADYRWY
jgi:hypothetical protein